MARILDASTRLIDIDFGPVQQALSRNKDEEGTSISSLSLNGVGQVMAVIPDNYPQPAPNPPVLNIRLAGSFIQYQRIDLSYMVDNNEVYQPIDVSVQRTSPAPTGNTINANNFDQIEEYIYVFTRPLNNTAIATKMQEGGTASSGSGLLEQLRHLGLDTAEVAGAYTSTISGKNAGIPSHAQTVYAEKRIYNINLNNAATISNGGITNPADPVDIIYTSLTGMPSLVSVTTWGTMGAITGPNLHAYRIIINRTQEMYGLPELENVNYAGSTVYRWPSTNISFFCKDANLSEGEYLTRVSNAMNSIPEGGRTA